MLVNVKLDVIWKKGLPFKVADLIGLFSFQWYNQNEVSTIDIWVLWRDREKTLMELLQSSSFLHMD